METRQLGIKSPFMILIKISTSLAVFLTSGYGSNSGCLLDCLTHLFPMHSFSTPWKHQKTLSFLMFSGGRERVPWEQMGLKWGDFFEFSFLGY